MNDPAAIAAKFNARLVTLSSFFSELTFILPIWLIYSLSVLRLKPTLAIAIFMSIWIVSAILEIPTGALADRLGRKRIFIIGQFLFALYPLAYAFKFPVPILFAVCLVSAVGSAMRSGALLPIVHASFKKAGFVDKAYEKFLSTNQIMSFLARALTGIAGAWLYTIDPKWPFFAMFVVTFLNFGLGFFIKDAHIKENEQTTNVQHIKHTLVLVRKSEVIMGVLLAFSYFSLVSEAIWTGYQVFYQGDQRSAFTIGLLFSVIAIFSALGAFLVRFSGDRFHPYKMMQLFGLGVLLTALLLAQPNHALRLLAIIPMGLG